MTKTKERDNEFKTLDELLEKFVIQCKRDILINEPKIRARIAADSIAAEVRRGR